MAQIRQLRLREIKQLIQNQTIKWRVCTDVWSLWSQSLTGPYSDASTIPNPWILFLTLFSVQDFQLLALDFFTEEIAVTMASESFPGSRTEMTWWKVYPAWCKRRVFLSSSFSALISLRKYIAHQQTSAIKRGVLKYISTVKNSKIHNKLKRKSLPWKARQIQHWFQSVNIYTVSLVLL